jgi:hypothetical protein
VKIYFTFLLLDKLNSHFLSSIRTQEKSSESETPPLRPKRGIKKGKGVSFAAEVTNSEEGTSSPASENKILLDQEAFACAVQNILGKLDALKLTYLFKEIYIISCNI